MGCDIHCTWEARRTGEKRWVNQDEWSEESGWVEAKNYGVLYWRNYHIFAMLADVRNPPLGEEHYIAPMFQPRGFPEDMSQASRKFFEDGMGSHSQSHCTLQELLDYDFTRTISFTEDMSVQEFHDWDHFSRGKGDPPKTKWVSRRMEEFRVVADTDFREHLAEALDAERIRLRKNDHPNGWIGMRPSEAAEFIERAYPNLLVRCTYTQHYYQLAEELITKTIPTMLARARKLDTSYEDVRLIFNFDN